MKRINFLILFLFSTHWVLYSNQKVYDCFLFFNEFDILTIRLHEMSPFVDKFVLVESVETHQGVPKPLNFQENKHLYSEFLDKIIHVVSEERLVTDNAWQREGFQRNQIMRGLVNCKDDDIIMVSDVDEIVERKGVETIRTLFEKDPNRCVGVKQRMHEYFLNNLPISDEWQGTVITSYGELRMNTPNLLKNLCLKVEPVVKGWHFSWIGDTESVLYKLGAFAHADLNTPEGRREKREESDNREKRPRVPIDDTFPHYVVENQEYFERIGFIIK